MKTIKSIMIVLFATLTISSFANLGEDKVKSNRAILSPDGIKTDISQKDRQSYVFISFKQAMLDPDLTGVMHQQLNNEFLNVDKISYVVEVYYKNRSVHIRGTYNDWVWFFSYLQ